MRHILHVYSSLHYTNYVVSASLVLTSMFGFLSVVILHARWMSEHVSKKRGFMHYV